MVILVTGFEPFGGIAENPSQAIVEALRQRPASERRAEIVTEILPCEFRAAGERIAKLIRELQPAAVVSVGLAAGATAIRLERHALNLNDARNPDNAGDLASGRPIDPAGPIGYWSTLPIDDMLQALKARDIPAMITNHAGAYVCNHVFFTARHEIERAGLGTPSGFVHVPLMTEQDAPVPPGGASLPLATMVQALECCLDVLAGQIAGVPAEPVGAVAGQPVHAT
jgi:pyroglutamyl-peptidase